MTHDPIAELFEQVAEQLHPAIDKIVEEAEQRGRRLRARRHLRLVAANTLALTAVVGLGVGLTVALPAARSGSAAPDGATGPSAAPTRSPVTTPTTTPAPSFAATPPRGTPTATPKQSSSATGSFMSRGQMLDTLRSLLPAGAQLSHVNTTTGAGWLEVDYDDGHGAVDLIVTVTPTGTTQDPLACPQPLWKDEGTRPAGALPISCTLRTLPDGGVERDAVTYADSYGFYGYNIYNQRPDGVTVFIQVANGINHTLPQVDRATPPGTMQQWTALVENPKWKM